MTSADSAARVHVGDGRIVLPQPIFALYMAGAGSVALVERDGQTLLLPLSGPAAGGLLLKQRNREGDRVVVAEDFLAARGFGRFSAERDFPVRWVAAEGGLLIEGLPVAST